MKTRNLMYVIIPAVFFGLARPLIAESGSSYAASAPTIPITSGGGVMIPSGVQKDLSNGKVPLNLSFVLLQSIMNSCTQDVLSRPPGQRTPYVDARKFFVEGGCKLQKCFLQGLVYDVVAQIGEARKVTNEGNGPDEQEIQGFAVQALALIDGASKGSPCGSGSNPIDPSLVALLQTISKGK